MLTCSPAMRPEQEVGKSTAAESDKFVAGVVETEAQASEMTGGIQS